MSSNSNIFPGFPSLPKGSAHWVNPKVDRAFGGYKKGDDLIGAISGNKKSADGYEKIEVCKGHAQVIWKGGVEVRERPSLTGRVIISYQDKKVFEVAGTVTNAAGCWVVARVHVADQSKYDAFWAFVRRNHKDEQYLQYVEPLIICPCCDGSFN